jgi:CheY-like chemotaxis protein
VVDDDPVTVRLVEAVLRSDGHEVATSSTGEQAAEAVEGGRYDLVLTDLRLPGMSGWSSSSGSRCSRRTRRSW